jgi:hypothetical protein
MGVVGKSGAGPLKLTDATWNTRLRIEHNPCKGRVSWRLIAGVLGEVGSSQPPFFTQALEFVNFIQLWWKTKEYTQSYLTVGIYFF